MRAGDRAGSLKENTYAMAKKKVKSKGIALSKAPLKRVITRTGEARYYQGGKRKTANEGAKKYVKQELVRAAAPGSLTREEQKLFNRFQAAQKTAPKAAAQSAERLRFGGRFVKNTVKLLLDELKLIGPTSLKELKKEFPDVKNYGDFLKKLKELTPKSANVGGSEYGLQNEKRNRTTFESTIDLAEEIDKNPLFKALRLVVVDEYGNETEGKALGLEAIRDWEVEKIEEAMKSDKGAAYVSFQHFGEIDITDDTFIIDLRESVVTIQYSP
jgi:hypothetical protein